MPTTLGQVLSLLNEALVNRTGQKSDALLGTGIGEVLTGHANGTAFEMIGDVGWMISKLLLIFN